MTTLRHVSLRAKAYRDIVKRNARLGHLLELGLALAKLHGAAHAAHAAKGAAALAALSALAAGAAEQEEEAREGDDREQQVAQQRHVVPTLQ